MSCLNRSEAKNVFYVLEFVDKSDTNLGLSDAQPQFTRYKFRMVVTPQGA